MSVVGFVDLVFRKKCEVVNALWNKYKDHLPCPYSEHSPIWTVISKDPVVIYLDRLLSFRIGIFKKLIRNRKCVMKEKEHKFSRWVFNEIGGYLQRSAADIVSE